jgi:hypothetical protein
MTVTICSTPGVVIDTPICRQLPQRRMPQKWLLALPPCLTRSSASMNHLAPNLLQLLQVAKIRTQHACAGMPLRAAHAPEPEAPGHLAAHLRPLHCALRRSADSARRAAESQQRCQRLRCCSNHRKCQSRHAVDAALGSAHAAAHGLAGSRACSACGRWAVCLSAALCTHSPGAITANPRQRVNCSCLELSNTYCILQHCTAACIARYIQQSTGGRLPLILATAKARPGAGAHMVEPLAGPGVRPSIRKSSSESWTTFHEVCGYVAPGPRARASS